MITLALVLSVTSNACGCERGPGPGTIWRAVGGAAGDVA